MKPAVQAVLAAISSFFVVMLVFLATLSICRGAKQRRKRRTRRDLEAKALTGDRTAANTDHSSSEIGESASFDPSLSRISMAELLHATHNFSPDLVVGDGGFGLVYKAKLFSGVTVAVKKLDADAFQGFREFRAEMETLGKIRHANIIKMLGYYAAGMDRILIYEFIEKGSLDQWLYSTSSTSNNDDMDTSLMNPRKSLSWGARIKIVKGVARGLAYLHSLETPIIHRDIKSSNVLLDSNFEAHIADFGLARSIEGSHSHVSTQVAGTMGYVPPEYVQGFTRATMMGDVYSFGILMMEIVTVQRPNWPIVRKEDGREVRLIQWIRAMMDQNRHMDLIDASILRDELKENAVVEFFRIASLCTAETYKCRPTMSEVVEMLDGILI